MPGRRRESSRHSLPPKASEEQDWAFGSRRKSPSAIMEGCVFEAVSAKAATARSLPCFCHSNHPKRSLRNHSSSAFQRAPKARQQQRKEGQATTAVLAAGALEQLPQAGRLLLLLVLLRCISDRPR